MFSLRENQTNAHKKFANLLAEVETAWTSHGIRINPSDMSDIDKLPESVVLKATSFLTDIHNSYEAVCTAEDNGLELEKMFLKRALDRFGFYVDDRFWDSLESGDLIEVYNSSMTQVYRSRNFFEVTGYSLLDLTANEWYNLFERPSHIQKLMEKKLQYVMENSLPLDRYDIPVHLMVERCDLGAVEPAVPRAVEVTFRNIATLRKHPLKPAEGFVVTCKAKLVCTGEDVSDIGFI